LTIFLTALAVIDILAQYNHCYFYNGTLQFANLSWHWEFLLRGLFKSFEGPHLILISLVDCMWYFMLHSGVHATITGVLLHLPFHLEMVESISLYILQHALHKPVAFIIFLCLHLQIHVS